MAAGLGLEFAQVVQPLGVKAKVPEMRPAEGVGLEDTEGQQAQPPGQGQQAHPQQALLAPLGGAQPGPAHQQGHGQQHSHREGADFRGHGRAVGQTKSQETRRQAAQRSLVQGNVHRHGHRRKGEQVEEVVHGEEVGLLDLHHGQGRESGGQQAHFAPVEAFAHPIDQQH